MPENRTTVAETRLPSFRDVVRDIPYVLRISPAARFAACGLTGVLVYLLVGRMIDPTFTDYWWYQLFQTAVTLVIVLFLNAMFADEGGMAIQTHVVVVGATLADTLGTAGDLYDRWGPYDKVVHFSSGAAFAAGAYQTLNFLHRRGILSWSSIRRAMIAAATSFLITGIVWETYEYMGDAVFASGRVQSRLDTWGDLLADTLGALVAVAVIHHREWIYERRPETADQLFAKPLALPQPDHPLLTGTRLRRESEYALHHLPGRGMDD